MNKNILYNKYNSPSAKISVALVGNPNCGKTTLFNALTGSNQKVGNWPGVTVERKTGICQHAPQLQIIDTPGCYSLSPFTPEEQIAAAFLKREKPDVILNVVDSTNLERNLLLTTQLSELNIPVVVALNMQDEARVKGIEINSRKLAQHFGCAFVPISAAKGEGIEDLIAACTAAATSRRSDKIYSAKSTEERYEFIERAIQRSVKIKKPNDTLLYTDKIDKILLNKWLALPIFILTITAIFFVSVDGLGGMLTSLIDNRLTPLLQLTVKKLLKQTPQWFVLLVSDGIIGGVMSVVGFVPQVMILFGCIAMLEACGYMSRIAFITDKLLYALGLSGRSFVCMILGCGCSVPAIMSTRTIKNTSERETTITLAPFVPCSAKLAVIAFFTSYVFDGNALFAVSFYFASIAAIIVGGLVLKLPHKKEQNSDDIFLMELPPYRLPKLQNVLRQMWERGKAFLIKAGTVIFAASVVLWILTNFDFRFAQTSAQNSMLSRFGRLIAPIFTPLGFNDRGCGWQFAVATVSGIVAKETVVTTLQILLPQGVGSAISPLGAYSFVLFNLFTMPCVAACSASFSEQGWKKGIKSALFQITLAYILSLTVYQAGRLFVT